MPRERLSWTRTTGQRIVLGINILLVVVLGTGALTIAYATQKLAAVERLDVADVLTAAPTEPVIRAADIAVATPVSTVPGQTTTTTEFVAPAPEIEENYLIIGSDNAERIAEGDQVLLGRDEQAANHLADTIMILRLRPSEGMAALLSIPRDLEVTIAGTTRLAKINTAFNHPDAETRVARLIDTVEENLDISLQHYVEVDLEGFRRLVDAVGGVSVCFDGPSRDLNTGLFIEAGGWRELAGRQALEYVRSRKLEIQAIGGTWDDVSPRQDLNRIDRQQDFLRETIGQTFANIISDPRLLISVLSIASEELVVSNTLNIVSDGSDLSGWFRGFADESLETHSLDVFFLPISPAHGNESRVGMKDSAETQLDVFRGIRIDDVVPKRVSIDLRGPTTLREEIGEGLEALGFVVGSQSATSVAPLTTVISYGLGGHRAATLVAAFLDTDVEFVQTEALVGNSLVIELGEADISVLTVPRSLESAAPPVVVSPTSVVEPTTTTTTEQRYEFDCSQPRPEA